MSDIDIADQYYESWKRFHLKLARPKNTEDISVKFPYWGVLLFNHEN